MPQFCNCCEKVARPVEHICNISGMHEGRVQLTLNRGQAAKDQVLGLVGQLQRDVTLHPSQKERFYQRFEHLRTVKCDMRLLR
mmetsp:Transcript_6784/g.18176  ORF Transcript_6784/g.18176 Transcript_6784/m.18176 type:complete len:83 (-) Transcript_6784:762-1010(-)